MNGHTDLLDNVTDEMDGRTDLVDGVTDEVDGHTIWLMMLPMR